ncbi:MAG TPA: alpha/beta fold hydrolase [Vicinamibacteria bacterium]|nr:alpha/beta fold hydrolase [Vicinamibacteria bacterium]
MQGITTLLLVTSIFTSAAASAAAALLLEPCPENAKARCGTLTVYENRESRQGRTIPIKVMVMPATGAMPASDPIVFFEGGPGASTVQAAQRLAEEFHDLSAKHDLIFIDLRGTGSSNGLSCELFGKAGDLQSALGDLFPLEAVRKCRAELTSRADLGLYTTSLSVDDVDDVRAALGYERLNLVGSSYGTRAALVYMRRHPDHVRTAVLMGVDPPTAPAPRDFPRDAQRALDGIFSECAREAPCAAAFPNLPQELDAVLARLRRQPAVVEIVHPETGEPTKVTLKPDLFAEALRYLSYNSGTASLIPALVHQSALGDLAAVAEFALFARQQVGALTAGLYLSITCAEDLPQIRPEEAERLAKNTFLGDYRYQQQSAACGAWVRGAVPPDFATPIHSDTPALLVTGEHDPVTPPRLAAEGLKTLPGGVSVVVPHGGHALDGLEGLDCVKRLIRDFVEAGMVRGLDRTCLASVRRPPFPLVPPTLKAVSLGEDALAKFAGRYAAEGLPGPVDIARQGTKLKISLPGPESFILVPVSPTRFRVTGTLNIFVLFEFKEGRVSRATFEENGETTTVLTPAGT